MFMLFIYVLRYDCPVIISILLLCASIQPGKILEHDSVLKDYYHIETLFYPQCPFALLKLINS